MDPDSKLYQALNLRRFNLYIFDNFRLRNYAPDINGKSLYFPSGPSAIDVSQHLGRYFTIY